MMRFLTVTWLVGSCLAFAAACNFEGGPRPTASTGPDAAATGHADGGFEDARTETAANAAAIDDGGRDTRLPDDEADVSSPDAAATDLSPDTGPTIAQLCFPNRTEPGGDDPDYDQFNPRVGAHCLGTNHQHVWGVEQVVFLGDSITVGTPPTLSQDFYRTKLASLLTDKFNLEKPGYLWQLYDAADGTSVQRESGSFKNCAKWGARADDLLRGGEQIHECFPDGGSDQTTLVVMTIGGNDVAAITKAGGGTDGRPLSELRAMTEQAVADLEEAVAWLTDPARFPNGSFVVFANPYEFTDGTGQTDSCPAASEAGIEEWDDPDALADLVRWLNEQWMRIAVDSGTDLIFMLENFCGHGFVATGPDADPNARCYLGPNTPRWFDDSCIHPNPTGHEIIAEMFMQVVDEPGNQP